MAIYVDYFAEDLDDLLWNFEWPRFLGLKVKGSPWWRSVIHLMWYAPWHADDMRTAFELAVGREERKWAEKLRSHALEIAEARNLETAYVKWLTDLECSRMLEIERSNIEDAVLVERVKALCSIRKSYEKHVGLSKAFWNKVEV